MGQTVRKVVVTGATGFMGQHLIPLLLKNNYEVIAVAKDTTKAQKFHWYRDVEFISCDIHKNETEIPVTQDTGLIHLAWEGLPNYRSLHHFEKNLPYNYNFVRSLVSKGVKQVLNAGTCFEYGLCSGPIPSNTTTNPANPYALAKDSLRRHLEFLALEIPFMHQWARIFYLYGHGQSPTSVLSQLDKAIASGARVFNMSGGEQLRDYLSVQDAVQQLFDLYINSGAGTYNICSGDPISIRSLVERRIVDRGANIELNLGFYPYSQDEPMAFWGVRDIW
jgi:dTDP-6-deoxy-L-talose 4-dehydrogenase (NAD+)